ncbi:MAG: hydroxyacylglutathione hydrolase [Gammaproteobacteria bacterium]|nr:hydroxyacylglutathione hydrolase [Gammaproteobacteria bacterium]
MLNVRAIRAFNDNYIWLIEHSASKQVVIVDPGGATPVINAINHYNVIPIAILITHQHYDHINGVKQLVEQFSVPVFGQKTRLNDVITDDISDQKQLAINASFPKITVINTPGHTPVHLSYLVEGNLFCGDTLFSAGCGRLLDQNARPIPDNLRANAAQQLYSSLSSLHDLPADTHIYCAHEYTLANLHFAVAVEPDNLIIKQRLSQIKTMRDNDEITLPSTIALEQACNPFLRCTQPQVIASAERYSGTKLSSPLAVFTALRAWKDNF